MITPNEIRDWTDAEVSVGARILNEEDQRRRTMSDALRQVDSVNTQYLLAVGRESGEPWVEPEGVQAAYPLGWGVAHTDRRWESTVSGNRSEPGTNDDWRDVTDEPDAGDPGDPEAQKWAPPEGNGFQAGALVEHKEDIWVSDVDNNVWEPGEYGWTKQQKAEA